MKWRAVLDEEFGAGYAYSDVAIRVPGEKHKQPYRVSKAISSYRREICYTAWTPEKKDILYRRAPDDDEAALEKAKRECVQACEDDWARRQEEVA